MSPALSNHTVYKQTPEIDGGPTNKNNFPEQSPDHPTDSFSGNPRVHREVLESQPQFNHLPTEHKDSNHDSIVEVYVEGTTVVSAGSNRGYDQQKANDNSLNQLPSISQTGAEWENKTTQKNVCNEEFANSVLQTLASMNDKLQKIDVIEALALETKKEVSGVNARIDTISEQLEAVKTDLKHKESKWEEGVSTLQKKVAHIETGCSKLEKRWEQHKGFVKRELNIAQTSLDSNSTRLGEVEQQLSEY